MAASCASVSTTMAASGARARSDRSTWAPRASCRACRPWCRSRATTIGAVRSTSSGESGALGRCRRRGASIGRGARLATLASSNSDLPHTMPSMGEVSTCGATTPATGRGSKASTGSRPSTCRGTSAVAGLRPSSCRRGGEVMCWGLEESAVTPQTTPLRIAGIDDAARVVIDAGRHRNAQLCVQHRDGRVSCKQGRGYPSGESFVLVPGISDARHVQRRARRGLRPAPKRAGLVLARAATLQRDRVRVRPAWSSGRRAVGLAVCRTVRGTDLLGDVAQGSTTRRRVPLRRSDRSRAAAAAPGRDHVDHLHDRPAVAGGDVATRDRLDLPRLVPDVSARNYE